MSATRISITLFLCVAAGSAFAGGEPNAGSTNLHADKAEKKAFKQHLKEERAGCKHHRHTVACNELKEHQRIEKHEFKSLR